MKFESFVQKAARAASAAVLKHRYLMGPCEEHAGRPGSMTGVRGGEEMARVVARAVRDAFREAKS